MKTFRSLLIAALLVPAAPGLAQFESARFHPDNVMPPYPSSLTMAGVTRGMVIAAVSVDAEGKVQDAMILAQTNDRLAENTLASLREWRFIPARLDGQAVPVQTEVRVDFTVEGAVVSSNVFDPERYLQSRMEGVGDNALTMHLCPANELDRLPALVHGDAPIYAVAANEDGVNGRVRVHFYITEQGEVRFACAVPDAHPYLMEQAVEAVRRWKFEPPTSHGRPVLVAAVQEFNFGAGGP